MNEHDLAEFYFTQAYNHFRLGDIDRAIKLSTKSIELNETQQYYIFRSTGHTTAAHIEESIFDANQAIKLNPMNPEALFCRAEAYFYAGEFELALVDYYQVSQMRSNDSRDAKGVSKCIECIRKATSDGIRGVDKLMRLLEDGALLETPAASASALPGFRKYMPDNETPRETSVSELLTQYVETEQATVLEKRTILHPNFCHMTPDKIFLQNTGLCHRVNDDVQNAISYIENRETFWRNQNKTRVFRETQRINRAQKTICDRADTAPPEFVQKRSAERRAYTAYNAARKICKPHEESALRTYINGEFYIMYSAKANYATGSFDKALYELNRLQTSDLDVQLLSSKALYKLGRTEEAIAGLEDLVAGCQARKMFNEHTQRILVDALALRVLAYKQVENFDEAARSLKQCSSYAEQFADTKACEFCAKYSRDIARAMRRHSAE